ncbi:MAG: hypothetical protein QXX49_04245 [Candidatus Caldarchaeum sp.]|uniref:VIT family protein n=1 Tax=Caldiarchaeum subterraneum TaxID=311458 RepID=A0A7J3VSL6_CALS0
MLSSLWASLKSFRRRLSLVLSYSGKSGAVRRYFFSNSFDGILAMVGLSLGASLAPSTQATTVVFAGLGMSVAMLVSGVSGIYLTESAETKRLIKELQASLLRDVSDTVIGRAGTMGTVIASLVGGFSTFILSLTVLSPYIAGIYYGELRPVAPHISTLIGLGLLFTLGLMMGRFSKTEVLKSGIKMVSIGVAAVLLILLLELFVGLTG